MSNLKYARTASLGAGEPGRPEPDLLIEGAPEFMSWPLIEARTMSGVWAASPGHHRVMRGEDLIESFYILEGEIELFEEGQAAPKRFGPGDLVVLEPGFRGSWKTISAMRKVYFTSKV
ncbi:cupin domain-containing protein [Albidovulum sp.]|uniref:cupin domain-containing protein n=1 Tax=Albidovulum sp. TaxID=1872424 RepID=UPI00302B86E2